MVIPTNNPYSFGTPIRDEYQFAGRNQELEDIDYSLNQVMVGKSLGIALIGEPGMGKTSLLNIIECHARSRGIVPIKVSLEKEFGSNELEFFRELYFITLLEIVKIGAFSESKSQLEQALRQLENASILVDNSLTDLTFPLRFPRIYSRCINSQIILPILVSVIEHDFKLILTEVKRNKNKAIALLIDNCDHISTSILEKMKVIITELSGYFVCFAGSNKFMQTPSEMLSPIPRILHKIQLLPFSTERATRECILNQIRSSPEYSNIDIGPDLVTEIHSLTGGNPYEIQMLCYLMYQQAVREKRNILFLHPTIFENVVDQLEFQKPDITDEKLFQQAIKTLTIDDLKLSIDYYDFEGFTYDEQALCENAFESEKPDFQRCISEIKINRKKLADLILVCVQDSTYPVPVR
jgi:hypothetical protein